MEVPGLLIVGGTPSSGKSRVILALIRGSRDAGRTGVVKVDCVTTSDDAWYLSRGVPAMRLLAERFCPDHAWLERLPEVLAWAGREGLDTLAVETAGLCARCAPYLREALAVCVLDATCGVRTPAKLGPHLADADLCVITKGDLVSQAEREVFEAGVRSRNPAAPVAWFNGLTGEGAMDLVAAFAGLRREGGPASSHVEDGPAGWTVRTPLPQLYCSYCLGRSEVGISAL